MRHLFCGYLLFIFLAGHTQQYGPVNTNNAFGPGEKLVFNVKYGILHGGYGRMEVLDTVRYRGRLCHTVRAVATSNKGLSLVYPVRDTNTSLIDAEGLFSHRIIKNIHEGRYIRFRTTDFTPDIGIARSVDHTVFRDSTFTTEPLIHDILSAFFFFRTTAIMDSIDIMCVDDFKKYPLRVRVKEKGVIKTDLGKFDCIIIEPLVTSTGIFIKNGKMRIWLTDDERRIPVLVKFKVPYLGSITCELIEYNPATIVKLD